MHRFYDLCLRETSEEMKEFARELGWTATSCDFNTIFLEAEDWGELKSKIGDNRSEADVLVFLGGDEELNQKAAGDSRIDIILHPERGRKDSGINHVIAEEAAENSVAIGFDLQQLMGSQKEQSYVLGHWRRNLMLAEKYGTPYILTTGAEQIHDLRAPRDLASLIDSLGYSGKESISRHPVEILERIEKVDSNGFVRPGVEVEHE